MLVVFNPSDVFQILYKDACQKVCKTGFLGRLGHSYLLPSGFVKGVEMQFVAQFKIVAARNGPSAAGFRKLKLLEHRDDWIPLQCDATCFACVRRRPQYRLPCGHFVCDNCVRVMGLPNAPWAFRLDTCLLCESDTAGFTIRMQPPTATVRLLSIDGGGARGIVPLIFLRALEERIGLPYPVQENFDIAFGTSSGSHQGPQVLF